MATFLALLNLVHKARLTELQRLLELTIHGRVCGVRFAAQRLARLRSLTSRQGRQVIPTLILHLQRQRFPERKENKTKSKTTAEAAMIGFHVRSHSISLRRTLFMCVLTHSPESPRWTLCNQTVSHRSTSHLLQALSPSMQLALLKEAPLFCNTCLQPSTSSAAEWSPMGCVR